MVKKINILCCSMILLSLTPIHSQVFADYLAIKKKGIIVKGGTTLGSFKCINTISQPDILYFSNYKQSSTLSFKIKVQEIDCSNKLLNKDVYKTLKAEEHPTIDVSISELKRVNTYYTATVNVEIVGKVLNYKNVILTKSESNLIGSIKLTFSQLGLTPKAKMGGFVKVKDNIEISFNLSY